MSSRGRRLSGVEVEHYAWAGSDSAAGTVPASAGRPVLRVLPTAHTPPQSAAAVAEPEPPRTPSAAEQQAHLAALERDAFTKGYAQGERAGLEAGAQRADAMLRRLAHTLEELSTLRDTVIRQSEQQLVQLAMAIARRVLRREVTVDAELIGALAHVALERVGPATPAVIRLHPDDYAVVSSRQSADWAGRQVQVLPDPAVARGGCLVESEFGYIDASVDAQVNEIARIAFAEAAPVAAKQGAA